VDERKLLRELDRRLNHVSVPEGFVAWLRRQPRAPALVGSSAAAAILGVPKPHVTRLRQQGRMPEAIPVEGSNDVYVRSEVVALARQLRREREARALSAATTD
jgi:hypothetical protein